MGTAKNSIEQASALYLQDHQSFSVSYELLKFRFHEKLCTEVFGGRDSARVNFAHWGSVVTIPWTNLANCTLTAQLEEAEKEAGLNCFLPIL